MTLNEEKIRFYSSRVGESPFLIFIICHSAHIIISSIGILSKNIKNAYLRSLFEIFILGILIFLVVSNDFTLVLMLAFPLFKKRERKKEMQNKRNYYLSLTKLSLLFLTTVCIIFVDFPSFPVSHGKVSKHLFFWNDKIIPNDLMRFDDTSSQNHVAISLMDCGAAIFVIMNGYSSLSFLKCLKNGIINTSLWFVRKLLTKSVNYYVPEGEYGKHCNFFGYIGFVQIIAAFVSLLRIPSSYFGLFILVIHEFTSHHYPILGYLSLYFISNYMGFKCDSESSIIKHILQFIIYFLPTIFSSFEILFPSREEVNASFILFIFSIIYTSFITGYYYPLDYDKFSLFYKAVDQNPLVFFGFSNILTGIINIIIDTNKSNCLNTFICTYITFVISSLLTIIFSHFKKVYLLKK